MSALYVFALTNQAAPPLNYQAHRIDFVEVAGIYAAVEEVETRPQMSESALRVQHEIVQAIAGSVAAILPARFGAFLDATELKQLVTMRRGPIDKALELVSRRAQMTVRVFSTEPASAVVRPAAAERAISGTAYLEQRRREASGAGLRAPATALAAAVRPLVVSERIERGQGRVEWTMYHLVNRDAADDYRRTAAPFESAAIAVTGPWPPFAFVPDLWT